MDVPPWIYDDIRPSNRPTLEDSQYQDDLPTLLCRIRRSRTMMRALEDAQARWRMTIDLASSLGKLKSHVRPEETENPCLIGLRSVCWKIFLLFQHTDMLAWPAVLADSRDAYTSLRQHFLRFIENPEELRSTIDPLDDDKDSPWNTLRQDEELRAEIFQDVERCMQDEPYFRRSDVQRMLLDILFIFCKLNQDVGYRQGMHELLAPLLWVVEHDSIARSNPANSKSELSSLQMMEDVLDSDFLEHDVFTLFALVMQSAKSSYELGEPDKSDNSQSEINQKGTSPIVARSKCIHEVYLARVDPELASHLTQIEILPQIFLIRWIRLLFGREFPFEDLLCLWDTIFAEDTQLELVDLICVAMLLRIRWELVEADYSVALTLLLKYPVPKAPHGPNTFVIDAVYLKEHLDETGGRKIIAQYSGKAPVLIPPIIRPETPAGSTLEAEVQFSRRRSPLSTPARFLQQQGVEALLHGAAKGMFERGEKLGINRVVREAVGEVRKNMQGLSTPNSAVSNRGNPKYVRWSLDDGQAVPSTNNSMTFMEERNKDLAMILAKASAKLDDAASSSAPFKDKEVLREVLARLEAVRSCLEDLSLPLPATMIDDVSKPTVVPTQTAADHAHKPVRKPTHESLIEPDDLESPKVLLIQPGTPDMDIADPGKPVVAAVTSRPRAPMPTRSSLAQSSFAFMLEPDTGSKSTMKPNQAKPNSPFAATSRKPTSGANRQKAAFLFGDEPEEGDKNSRKSSLQDTPEEIFKLGAMKRNLGSLVE